MHLVGVLDVLSGGFNFQLFITPLPLFRWKFHIFQRFSRFTSFSAPVGTARLNWARGLEIITCIFDWWSRSTFWGFKLFGLFLRLLRWKFSFFFHFFFSGRLSILVLPPPYTCARNICLPVSESGIPDDYFDLHLRKDTWIKLRKKTDFNFLVPKTGYVDAVLLLRCFFVLDFLFQFHFSFSIAVF